MLMNLVELSQADPNRVKTRLGVISYSLLVIGF